MEDEKISGNFIKISENEEYLFLLIKMTTKNNGNSNLHKEVMNLVTEEREENKKIDMW